MGILLDEMATAAWRRNGEMWKRVGSRIVMARLKWVGRRQWQSGGSRESSDVFMTVICACAPTARDPPEVKFKFSSDWAAGHTRQSFPEGCLSGVRWLHCQSGYIEASWRRVVRESGEAWFEWEEWSRRRIHAVSCTEPTDSDEYLVPEEEYQLWHLDAPSNEPVPHDWSDLIVVRAKQKVCCGDVQVIRGANCWTDHKLVRVKLRIALPHVCGKREKRMQPFSMHKLSAPAMRDEYRSHLERVLQEEPHSPDLSSEENWSV